MSLRSDLKALIDPVLVGSGVTVYDHLSEVTALPAVVVQRNETVPKTTGGPNNLEHEFTLHLVVPRGLMSYVEDTLEDTFMTIALALASPFRWVRFSGAEATTVDGVDAVSARLDIIGKE